jgi:hypothetical protein
MATSTCANNYTARSEAAWAEFKSCKDAKNLRKIASMILEEGKPEEIGSSDINCKCVDLIMAGDVVIKDGKAFVGDNIMQYFIYGICVWN